MYFSHVALIHKRMLVPLSCLPLYTGHKGKSIPPFDRSVDILHLIFTGVEVLSPFTPPEFRFLPSIVTPSPGLHADIYPHLLLLLSPIRVAWSLIDVGPNGFWKRPFSLCCWHCCSDKMIKLLVGDKRRQGGWQRQGWNSKHNGGCEVGPAVYTVSVVVHVCRFVPAVKDQYWYVIRV